MISAKDIKSKLVVISKILALMVGSIFAGYTVTRLHKDFLKHFEKWYLQFIVFFLIAFSFYDMNVSKIWVILLNSILFLIIVRVSIKYINEYYKKRE